MAGPLHSQGTRTMNFAPPRVANFSSPRPASGHSQGIQASFPSLPEPHFSGLAADLPMSPPPAMAGGRPIYMPDDYAMKLEEWRNGGYEHYKMKLDQIGKKDDDDPLEDVPGLEFADEGPLLDSPDAESLPPLDGPAGEHKRKKPHKEHKHSNKHSNSHLQVKKVELVAYKPKPSPQKDKPGLLTFLRPKPKGPTKEQKRHHKKGSKDEKAPVHTPPESEAELEPEPVVEAPEEAEVDAAPSGLPKLVKKVSFLLEKKHSKKAKKKEKEKVVLVAAKKEHGKKQSKGKTKEKEKGKAKAKGGKVPEATEPEEVEAGPEEVVGEHHVEAELEETGHEEMREDAHEGEALMDEPPHLGAEIEAAAPVEEVPTSPAAKNEEQIVEELLEESNNKADPIPEEATPPAPSENSEPVQPPEGEAEQCEEPAGPASEDAAPALEHEDPTPPPPSEPDAVAPEENHAEEAAASTEEKVPSVEAEPAAEKPPAEAEPAEEPPAEAEPAAEEPEHKPKRSALKRKKAKAEPRRSAISQELFGSEVESELDLHSIDGIQWEGELQDAPPPPPH